jgi:hypothetical protein
MNARRFFPSERSVHFVPTALLAIVGIPLVLVLFGVGGRDSQHASPSLAGLCAAAQKGEEIFTVDLDKQKESIEKDFAKAKENANELRLQNARSVLGLVEHKIKQLTPSLSKEEALTLKNRLDGANKYLAAVEDSLGNHCLEILRNQGSEAALNYMQQDMRSMGVSEQKLGQVEKTILDEAPQIEQAKERAEIDQTVKLLSSGKPVDPGLDSYILKTAQQIVKQRADSVKAIEDAKKRKEDAEHARLEKIRLDKEAKEKKIEDARQAKIKAEEEKKRLAEEKIEKERKAVADKQEQERQKRMAAVEAAARKDSLDALKKQQEAQLVQQRQAEKEAAAKAVEDQRLAQAEQERQKRLAATEEAERQDSLDAARKQEAAAQAAQAEKERQAQLIREQHLAAVQQAARQDSLDAMRKQGARAGKERQAQLEREQQLAAAQQAARQDSIDA